MGLIQSVACSLLFCAERALTWACCAFVLILLMFVMLMLMIYGISVGYHYAQKELANFAMLSRSTTDYPVMRRAGGRAGARFAPATAPANRSVLAPTPPTLPPAIGTVYSDEIFRSVNTADTLYDFMDSTEGTVAAETLDLDQNEQLPTVLETESSTKDQSKLSPYERDMVRKIIGRFRRSRNNTIKWSYRRPMNHSDPQKRFGRLPRRFLIG